MNYFKDLIDKGIYGPTINYQKMFQSMWNNHCSRNSREAEGPGGKPDVLYYTPSQSEGIECKLPLNHTDLKLVTQNIEYPDFPGYTSELQEIAGTVMAEQNSNLPDNYKKARELYLKLVEEIQSTYYYVKMLNFPPECQIPLGKMQMLEILFFLIFFIKRIKKDPHICLCKILGMNLV